MLCHTQSEPSQGCAGALVVSVTLRHSLVLMEECCRMSLHISLGLRERTRM